MYSIETLCDELSDADLSDIVTTSDKWMRSEIKVRADVGVLLLNTRNQVQ